MHEIYLLTRQEWRTDYPDEVRSDGAICPHRLAVLDALRRGLSVPSRVMADYLDLLQKYPQLSAGHGSAPAPGLGVASAARTQAGEPQQRPGPSGQPNLQRAA